MWRAVDSGRMDYDAVLGIARDLPGVEEGSCYGTPALRVRKKLFARSLPDEGAVVLRATAAQRAALIAEAPDVFYVTDHYVDHPWVLVRLSRTSFAALAEVVEQAWRQQAPPRLVAEHDGR